MSESETPPAAQPSPPPPKTGRDKGKIIFALAIAGLLVLAWKLSRGTPPNLDWPENFPQALQQAKAENRRVLVQVTASTPGENERKMNDQVLSKDENVKAIEEGRFILTKVIVLLTFDDAFSREHQIRKVPTWLILDSQGNELNRREGYIGEIAFRKGFLDCQEVVQPGK